MVAAPQAIESGSSENSTCRQKLQRHILEIYRLRMVLQGMFSKLVIEYFRESVECFYLSRATGSHTKRIAFLKYDLVSFGTDFFLHLLTL